MEFERQDVGDKARLLDVPERERRTGMEHTVEVWWRETGEKYRNERIGYYIMDGCSSPLAIEFATKDTCEKYHQYVMDGIQIKNPSQA